MFIIYEFKDSKDVDSTFVTAERVQELCLIEKQFFTLPMYPDYCVLTATGVCEDAALSFPLQFYGMDHDWTCPLLTDTNVNTKLNEMIDSLDDEDGVGMIQYGFFFDKNVQENNFPLKVRSLMNLGAPLKGFISETDEITKQHRLYEGFISTWEDSIWEDFGKTYTFSSSAYNGRHIKGDMEIRYSSFDIQQLEFQRIVKFDMLFSIGSICFVFFWIYMHVGSFFIASVAMLQIVGSLPIGNFFYKVSKQNGPFLPSLCLHRSTAARCRILPCSKQPFSLLSPLLLPSSPLLFSPLLFSSLLTPFSSLPLPFLSPPPLLPSPPLSPLPLLPSPLLLLLLLPHVSPLLSFLLFRWLARSLTLTLCTRSLFSSCSASEPTTSSF